MIQTAYDRQKSYADLKRKPMEFQVGDKVMLKVGVIAYKLELPQELSRIHNMFHVSNLKKCYSDDPLVVPLEGLQVDDKLHFVEEPVEIMDRKVKQLRRSRVPIVKCDDLIVKLNQPEFTAATYKTGLATVEEQLITYRKNEVIFSEEVTVLKREVACKDYEINITDKSKKGLGYNAIPPTHPLIYNRPKKLDLSYYGLDEFKEPKFKSYGSKNSKQESNIVCDQKLDDSKENSDDPLVKEQVSKDTSCFVESPLNVDKRNCFS
ncbi:hypothetical protein Tco_1522608 [Tanacetum coccineum]